MHEYIQVYVNACKISFMQIKTSKQKPTSMHAYWHSHKSTDTYTQPRIHKHKHRYVHTYINAYKHTYIHACTHTFIDAHIPKYNTHKIACILLIHTYMHANIHLKTQNKHRYIHANIYANISEY